LARSVLDGLDRFFETRSRNVILLICLVLAILVGVSDFQGLSGVLIIYMGPIALAAWYGGKRVGAVIAVYCATAWFLAVAIMGHSMNLPAVWSLLARLLMFLILTQIISRLRESMRQQRELMQFIVHDLRTPLSSAITGLLTLQQTSANMPADDAEMIQLALISNQRALELVNSLLDVAKLETGKMSLNLERTGIEGMVSQCFDQVALWAKGADVSLRSDVKLMECLLDPVLTSRVIVNLLSNALKFSPPGSEVLVTVVPSSHGGARFTVRDHGPGIPADYLDAIFDPFSQAKGTRSGTGLGLTFCRLAVQAQGGRIWVESAAGKGTTMYFTVPGRSAADKVAAAVTEPV
jgi:signal transduction histidine kinase